MLEQALTDNLLVRIFEQPLGWRLWLFWLMALNTAAFLFLGRVEGKVIALVWLANGTTMFAMYWIFGYTRILGLSHILWWTPMLIWLIPRFVQNRPQGIFAVWLGLLIVSDMASLVIDYIDVARYFLGETGEV